MEFLVTPGARTAKMCGGPTSTALTRKALPSALNQSWSCPAGGKAPPCRGRTATAVSSVAISSPYSAPRTTSLRATTP